MVPFCSKGALASFLNFALYAASSAFFCKMALVVVVPLSPGFAFVTLPSLFTQISTTTVPSFWVGLSGFLKLTYPLPPKL